MKQTETYNPDSISAEDLTRLTDPVKLAEAMKRMPKRTPVKAYVQGKLENRPFRGGEKFGSGDFFLLFGEHEAVLRYLLREQERITAVRMECDRRNSVIPTLELTSVNARVEPGAVIRQGARLSDRCVVMMGAVINVGAQVGEGSMIDMNAVLGARAIVGRNVHVGANAVIAGVLEPPSDNPVILEDHVMIGAGAVVLEGVRVKSGSVVAAGAVVIHDVPEGCVVAGVPARIIKKSDDQTRRKTRLLEDLR